MNESTSHRGTEAQERNGEAIAARPAGALPYKISVLVYIQNEAGELLLMKRRKSPNQGLWSSIGGKLEQGTGESPYECARRETMEEVGLELQDSDLHLFGMIAEKAYEGGAHYLMFLFEAKPRLTYLPEAIDEGEFAFHRPETIYDLPIPETDRVGLWPAWFHRRQGFISLRADCTPGKPIKVVWETAG